MQSKRFKNSVLWIFVDGLGLGSRACAVNPLAAFRPTILNFFDGALQALPCGGHCLKTDANLGVEGLPQSATGQTSLFTGLNAQKMMGRHLQGFPNQKLKELIGRWSVFQRLKDAGKQVTFANAYTPEFFERPSRRVSVTTSMCLTAGVALRTLQDLAADRALFMDYTNRLLRKRGHATPLRNPQEAARVLHRTLERYDLCLYEYFLTDLIGHRGTMRQAVRLLEELDRFVAAVVEQADLERLSIILTSDHGNIEDMTTSSHTRNPVPTAIWGPLRKTPASLESWSIDQTTPLVLEFLCDSL